MKTNTNMFESHLNIGLVLQELNVRARQYCKGNGMSVKASQTQVKQDFALFIKDGEIVTLPEKEVKQSDHFSFFVTKE